METFHNTSKVKFFEESNLEYLEANINAFIKSVKRVYAIKHIALQEEGYIPMHYVMVSYE